MKKEKLEEILEKHRLWIRGDDGGKRADLSSADLSSADLRSADLSSADLSSADLRYASLRYASLRSADLSSADLSYASLSSASLSSASLPAPSVVLLANWRRCSDETTLALMRLDASAHPDGAAAFNRWASAEDGPCPYDEVRVQRVVNFEERRELWTPGPPPTLWEAMCMVLDEHCEGWRGE